jgi:Protein of unknown function (DUF2934)
MVRHGDSIYGYLMKNNHFPQDRNQKPASAPRPATTAGLSQDEKDFVPSPDEVARRAYFCYVNEGSPEGREVQHWLVAEAELIAERKVTRTHGAHNGI